MILKRTIGWSSIVALTVTVACSSDLDRGDPCANIENDVKNSFDTLARFVAIETHRAGSDDPNEEAVLENIKKLEAELQKEIVEFNLTQKADQLVPFNWQVEKRVPGNPIWRVFGAKLGRGPYRVAIATHLDTVPPGDKSVWDPFTLKREIRKNTRTGNDEEFWVGRGAIDDKGPAVSTLQVLKAIARKYDGSSLLDHITVELFFDTSEETSISTSQYFAAQPQEEPDLALIFDASWCVRAEKGVERPVFSVVRDPSANKGVWIDSLNTPPGPANQVPDQVEAIIKADTPAALADLAGKIDGLYKSYGFDDPAYRRAELTVDTSVNGQIKLITKVQGAQHGSRPQENRKDGANPLISLTNFLAGLVKSKAQPTNVLADNDVGRMCKFIAWNWGTQVFGEVRPGVGRQTDLLKRQDEVFTEGNGTTYALTRFYTGTDQDPDQKIDFKNLITLRVDIRYALPHHSSGWDGQTEGFVTKEETNSILPDMFRQLVTEFNASDPGPVVALAKSATGARPDIRLPGGPTFSKISAAYEAVMKAPCPPRAIGGGTDAKGHTNFLAAGALFEDTFGPPINFHGLNEAAPVSDLQLSTKIVCKFIDGEIQRSPTVQQSLRLQNTKTPWGAMSSSHEADLD